jgi:hypothetical protein
MGKVIKVSDEIEVKSCKETIDDGIVKEFCLMAESYFQLKIISDQIEKILEEIKQKIVELRHIHGLTEIKNKKQKFLLSVYSKEDWNRKKLREILGEELFSEVVEEKEVLKVILPKNSEMKEKIKQSLLKEIPKKWIKEGKISIQEGTASQIKIQKIKEIQRKNSELYQKLYQAQIWAIVLQLL